MIETKKMHAKKPRQGRMGDHAASVFGKEAFKIRAASRGMPSHTYDSVHVLDIFVVY